MLDLEDIAPGSLRPLMREEYDKLIELGVFEDEPIELLRGMLVKVSPQGDRHRAMVTFLNRRLIELTDRTYDVSPGGPIAATPDSEPEPDFSIHLHDPTVRKKPTSALLVIEVSNSSLRKDRKIKKGIYAEAMVPEYWIIDVSREGVLVEVYTEPDGTTYAQKRTLRDGDVLRALHAPIEIAVADLPR